MFRKAKLKPAASVAQTCLLLLSLSGIWRSLFEKPGTWGCGLVYLCMALSLASIVRFARKPTGVLILACMFLVLAVSDRNAVGPMLPMLAPELQKTSVSVSLTAVYLICLFLLVRVNETQEAIVKKQASLAILAASVIVSGISVFSASFFLFAEPARKYWGDFPFGLLVCALSSISLFVSLLVAVSSKFQSDVKLRVALIVCTIAAAALEYSTRARWDLFVLSSIASISSCLLLEIDLAKASVEPSHRDVRTQPS